METLVLQWTGAFTCSCPAAAPPIPISRIPPCPWMCQTQDLALRADFCENINWQITFFFKKPHLFHSPKSQALVCNHVRIKYTLSFKPLFISVLRLSWLYNLWDAGSMAFCPPRPYTQQTTQAIHLWEKLSPQTQRKGIRQLLAPGKDLPGLSPWPWANHRIIEL